MNFLFDLGFVKACGGGGGGGWIMEGWGGGGWVLLWNMRERSEREMKWIKKEKRVEVKIKDLM